MLQPRPIRHYLTDHLGTPIALVDANGPRAGQVTWAASYNAWGDVKEEFNPFNLQQLIRFQGQQVDLETGLHYNRFRYYDSSVGGYLTQDPIGILGGLNPHSYPGNPKNYIDPLGLVVAIEGSPEFKAQVEKEITLLKSKPNGAELYNKLNNSKNTHTIKESKDSNSASANDWERARNGKGCGTTIKFNPKKNTGGTDDKGSDKRPPHVGLAHEMGHSLEMDKGIDSPDMAYSPKSTPPGEAGSIAAENSVRKEHGLPMRSHYYP